MGLFEDLLRYAEPAATLGSGAIAEPIAGWAGILGGSVEDTRNALTYQPRTAQGQAGLNALANALRSAKTTMVDENPPVNALVNALRRGTDYVGERSPMAGAALATLPTAAMAFMGPGSSVTRQAFSNVGRGVAQDANLLAQAMARNAAHSPMPAGSLASQRGAITWHGSPHKFDKFDMNKIGTGEGAQVYGRGLYFADSPDVAKSYAGDLAAARANKPVGNVDLTDVYQYLPEFPDKLLAARRDFRALADMGVLDQADRRDFLTAARNTLNAAQGGNMYKVDIPDEVIAKMIDFDAPVPEQIRANLSKAALDEFGSGVSMGAGHQVLKQIADEFKFSGHPDPNAAAAQWLNSRGVPGIRYLDQASRAAGNGTYNYVVFDDSIPRILEHNGSPIK